MKRTLILVQDSFARTCAPMMMKVGGFLFGSVMFLANKLMMMMMMIIIIMMTMMIMIDGDDNDDNYLIMLMTIMMEMLSIFSLIHNPTTISISTIIIIVLKYNNLNQSIFWFDAILHRVLINIYITYHIICHDT